MRVSLAVLAAFLASNQNNELSVSAFQPSRDLNRQHLNTPHEDPNHPRQSTRLNDASAMPYLDSWKILPDGNIQGIIFGHPFLENGDMVTTSQIKDSETASENQIIETQSGSQYLLRDRDADSSEGEIGIEEQQGFGNNVAGPLLGSAVLAAGAVGFGMSGEGARFDTAAPAQAVKEFSVASLSQIQNFEKSVEHALDMPYLATQVSEAEKQFQAARENMFKQRGPGSDTAAVNAVFKEKAEKFEQALSVAKQKVAIEKAALNEKNAWENVVNKEIMKEKAETDVMNTASSVAAKALSENKFDEAEAATEQAKMARAAVMEIQAERESAILAEESAEAEELFAEQDVMKVMNDIKQMATMYSVKAAGFKPADVLYMFGDFANTEKLGQYMSTTEGQVAVGSIAAATTVGTLWAAGKRDSVEEETTSMAASTTDAKKGVPEAARAQTAPVTASTPANGASADDKSNWGSYLDVLGSYGSGSAAVQSSYSPFGKKASGMTSHTSLYGPPVATATTPAAATTSSTTAPPAAPVTVTAAAAASTTATTTTATPAHNGRSSFGGSGYLDALSGPPGAAVMTSYSPFAQKSPAAAAPKKPEVAAHIRLAYKEWCEYYGKKSDDSRLEIFADNFAQAKEFYKESGRALLLNEYADLTANEYKMLPSTA